MATSSYDGVYALGTTKVIVPSGISGAAALVEGVSLQVSTVIKYASGGSLEVIGVGQYATLSPSAIQAQSGQHYLMGTSEVLTLNGPAKFYLYASNATTIAYVIKNLGQASSPL